MCIFLVMTYFANSFVLFLISWALCGVAVGGFMTGPFLIVMDIYEQKDWGKMSGNLVTALSAGMIVGPIVGGLLVDAGSLRGIFLLPIPFFIVAGIIQYAFYPNKKRGGKHSFDALGVILLIFAMVPFVVILNFAGNMFPWKSALTFILAAVTVIAAILLYRRETRIEQPAFALGALKNRVVLVLSLTCLLASAYSVLSAGFLVYFAQAVLQVSATSSATLLRKTDISRNTNVRQSIGSQEPLYSVVRLHTGGRLRRSLAHITTVLFATSFSCRSLCFALNFPSRASVRP